jgi:hypothetical protein
MLKPISFLFLVSLLLASCGQSLEDYMVGKWETQVIDLEMPSAYGQDTIVQYKVDFRDETDPRSSLKARSVYKADGFFEAHYLDEQGQEVGHTPGSWSIKDEVLNVQYEYNGAKIDALYDVEITDYGWKAVSIHDWDDDGEKDDKLYMEAVRIE